jgi:hypothetical protein
MAAQPTCLVCHKPMEKGFMTDHAETSIQLPRWCAGEPEPSWWTGGKAKEKQYRSGYPVVAYRCPQCEALRLYAPTPTQPDPNTPIKIPGT